MPYCRLGVKMTQVVGAMTSDKTLADLTLADPSSCWAVAVGRARRQQAGWEGASVAVGPPCVWTLALPPPSPAVVSPGLKWGSWHLRMLAEGR